MWKISNASILFYSILFVSLVMFELSRMKFDSIFKVAGCKYHNEILGEKYE